MEKKEGWQPRIMVEEKTKRSQTNSLSDEEFPQPKRPLWQRRKRPQPGNLAIGDKNKKHTSGRDQER